MLIVAVMTLTAGAILTITCRYYTCRNRCQTGFHTKPDVSGSGRVTGQHRGRQDYGAPHLGTMRYSLRRALSLDSVDGCTPSKILLYICIPEARFVGVIVTW